jgi:acetyl-CoA C-acetyltransferase
LLLKKNQLSVLDLDVIELMEAYAAQAIICAKELKLPIDRINLSGGSLSRGHPIGASGAVLAVRMLNELKNEDLLYLYHQMVCHIILVNSLI